MIKKYCDINLIYCCHIYALPWNDYIPVYLWREQISENNDFLDWKTREEFYKSICYEINLTDDGWETRRINRLRGPLKRPGLPEDRQCVISVWWTMDEQDNAYNLENSIHIRS